MRFESFGNVHVLTDGPWFDSSCLDYDMVPGFSKVFAHFCKLIFGRLFICLSTSVVHEFEAISISFKMTPKKQKSEVRALKYKAIMFKGQFSFARILTGGKVVFSCVNIE